MERAYYKEEALFNYNEVIESGGKFFLGDIIPEAWYERWFSKPKKGKGKIFILNKGRCGNGGTTGFINYARKNCKGLLVSVPNRSIVLSKESESKDLCCVYGGAENIDKERNIRVCTWDKTESVEGFANCGVEVIDIDKFFESDSSSRIWAGSLLVIDEYHKLIDDSNYRDICYDMVERIMTTDSNVVLMSATLNREFIDFLEMFSGKEVETYNVQYDDEGDDKKSAKLQWMDRGKGIRTYDIVCEIINTARKKKEEYDMYPSRIGLKYNQVVFFYNSVKEITNIVKAMPDKSDVEGNTNATINKSLTPIFKGVKECCKKGWISRENCEEICDMYLNNEGKSFDDSMEKECLNIEQLKKFIELASKAKYERTREIADIFLFSSFTGLRVSDLISLKWSEVNMDGNMISHKQYKNHAHKAKMLYIPLNDTSRKILEKWKDKHEEFVFGLLPSGYDLSNATDFKKVKNAKTRTINQSLRSIGDKMGLPFNLHIHLGRHTFAMIALNGGVNIKTTSSMLGHASTMVTEKVYATLLPNTIAEEVRDKLNIKLD